MLFILELLITNKMELKITLLRSFLINRITNTYRSWANNNLPYTLVTEGLIEKYKDREKNWHITQII